MFKECILYADIAIYRPTEKHKKKNTKYKI